MSYVLLAVCAVLVAALQVTVVPMFTVAGATADLGLVAILVTLLAFGPRQAMFMTPAVALTIGLSSDRSPGLLLMGYTAILPLGYVLDRYAFPPGTYARLLLTATVAGVWIRTVLAAGAFASGADFEPVTLITSVLIPGIAFDAILTTLAYVVLRLFGHTQVRFSLERQGWLP